MTSCHNIRDDLLRNMIREQIFRTYLPSRKDGIRKVQEFASVSRVPDRQWVDLQIWTLERRKLPSEPFFCNLVAAVLRAYHVVVGL